MKKEIKAIFIFFIFASCANFSSLEKNTEATFDIKEEKKMEYYSIISPEELEERIKNKESFIFVSTTTMCGSTESSIEEISKFSSDNSIYNFYIIIFDESNNINNQSSLLKNILENSFFSVPALHLFKDGVLVDVSSMVLEKNGLNKFIKRNTNSSSENLIDKKTIADSPEKRRKVFQFLQELRHKNLQGIDASNMSLILRNYEGSDMRNMNFENATLKNINFSFSDLRGANFKNVKFEGKIFWGNAICPDGSYSKNNNFSCMLNLNSNYIKNIIRDDVKDNKKNLVDFMNEE